ncbi:hypothetical protein B0H21DRAFT_713195 [Amylocystis lapponica]|nr:hypothetical protein B0H21DRAFT_713195 [Amylocystis lapponica]
MAKSYWTKEQNKLINQARPAWNAAEDQPKRTEILEELGCPEEPPESSAEEGKKAKLDYMRNKTWRHVVQEKYKARIDDICKDLSSGDRPGGQKWLGVYQKAVSQVCDGVTEAEKDELKAEANRQNREGFLPEEQRKLVVKEGDKIVKKFAEDVFKMLGMRVWVLGAFQAVNGKVNVSCFDNNDSIGNGDLVTDVIKEWDETAMWNCGGVPEQDAGDDSDDDLPKRKKKLPRPEMDLDDEGLPIIPAGTDERVKSLRDKKAIIAKFLSMHYVLCCGKANAKVPWAAIQASPKDYIESSHVPRRFVLREPTKMVQDDVDALLAHWRERQADDNCEVTFQFKAYKGSDNRPRPPVERAYDEDSEEDEGEGKGKGKGKAMGAGRGKGKAKEKGTRKGKGNGKYHDEETEPSDSAPDSDDPNGWDSARDGSSDEEEEEEDDLGEELEAEDESEVEALTNAGPSKPPRRRNQGGRREVKKQKEASESHGSHRHLRRRLDMSPHHHPKTFPLYIRSPPLPPSGKKAAEACVRSILSMPAVGKPDGKALQWEWGSWKYESAWCSPTLHTKQTERDRFMKWVNANPTMNRYNEMHVSKAKLELIALTVGMVIHDIEASQFATGDPDEEPEDGSIPPYVLQSCFGFESIEDDLLPFCAKITKQIAELTRTPPPPHRVTRKDTGSLKPKRQPDAAKEDDDDELPAPPKKTNKRNRPPPKRKWFRG